MDVTEEVKSEKVATEMVDAKAAKSDLWKFCSTYSKWSEGLEVLIGMKHSKAAYRYCDEWKVWEHWILLEEWMVVVGVSLLDFLRCKWCNWRNWFF